MSSKQKREETARAIIESTKFKKQKREVVKACGELLAKVELENEKLVRAVRFWKWVTVALIFVIIALVNFIAL